MYATKPCRYVIDYEDSETHERLKQRAIARGTYTEDCDDWFDPAQIAAQEDAGDSLAHARRLAKKLAASSVYGQARIMERVGIEEAGAFWDYDTTREIETVNA